MKIDDEFLKRIASLTIHKGDRKLVFTTKDMLWNQLKRDGPSIAESFDRLFSEEIDSLGGLFGEVGGMLINGLDKGDEFQKESGFVLMNSLNTYVASLHLFRLGHRLESLMFMRMIVESISVVLHLKTHPNDIKLFQKGQLKSTKCVSSAKRVIPPLGEIYGHLSSTVNHIHDLHRSFNPLNLYKERDEAVSTNFGYLRLSLWMLYITAELIYYDFVAAPRYWKKCEQGYRYNPSDEVNAWMRDFLSSEGKDSPT
jgi:hypothetical protein